MADGMTMSELAAVLPDAVLEGNGDVVVTDVTHDSRQAGPGSLFVAIRGFTVDGHRFVRDAVEAGAAGVCVEERSGDGIDRQLVVPSTRDALAPLSAEVHGRPSRSLAVVGVTGTNGKTTVAHMIESVVEAAGDTAGIIGTLGARSGGNPVQVSRTTPEASDVQRLLRRMVDDDVDTVAMEVSSHAIVLKRAGAIDFAVAAFTNLSQDHLDFHGDMETYFEAKAALFDPHSVAAAVVVIDDEYGARLAERLRRGPLAAGLRTASLVGAADLRATALTLTDRSSSFTVAAESVATEVEINLPGRFNVANALVAFGCCLQLGYGADEIARGLRRFEGVAGRMQAIDAGQPFAVVVDYAHTPEGVAASIAAARETTAGRVIAVVGSAGDRDQAKRPLMGAAASSADLPVITSDNPRTEDPDAVVAEVVDGVISPNVEVEVDRRRAIRLALERAGPGDVVLVLGRGHEPFQETNQGLVPFLDADVVVEEWQTLAESRPPSSHVPTSPGGAGPLLDEEEST